MGKHKIYLQDGECTFSLRPEYISHTVIVYPHLVSGDLENAFLLDFCPTKNF